ncbi:class I SAM-dependent methyltransferase [Amycolatopsis alkalitolerans]|uniref:Class I SAM-dependent methyltransferase n=1 Tax=Amycolatopsis alkalitolerans TaxID=2547244 RepID=A0A5C4M1P3_9PSEU|nr:class I SAM-dependent methyltransferase [Amycolatopsis alkalitolerans]TNC24844.1 class I SAM-dependent methyltransferase [Amycolatopsis alkalitolerans]
MPALPALVRDGVNRVLRPLGVQVVRGHSDDPAIRPFLPARRILAGARRAGVPVEDYLDAYSAAPGATAEAANAMLRMADLGEKADRVCEIGAGSGRYARRVISALNPEAYEIYETASDWVPYLRGLPGAVIRDADGHTLRQTETGSVDLAHSHKVFVYLPFVVTAGYLYEMARVLRPGGVAAFDVVTEDCLDEETTRGWVEHNAVIYGMVSRHWVVDLLARRGLSLVGSHFEPLSGGWTELLVFVRN